jgi:hypothetical protein
MTGEVLGMTLDGSMLSFTNAAAIRQFLITSKGNEDKEEWR